MHILRRLRDRGITYEQLQAATSDVESQLQAESRPMLTELYKVAKYEESYIRGEIGQHQSPSGYRAPTDNLGQRR